MNPAHVLKRLPDEDLAAFVEDLVGGRIFTSAHVSPPEHLHLVFLPVALGAFKDWTREEVDQIGVLYEHLDKAGPRSINGMPGFFSARLLHRDDWKIARERYEKAQAALRAAAAGEGE